MKQIYRENKVVEELPPRPVRVAPRRNKEVDLNGNNNRPEADSPTEHVTPIPTQPVKGIIRNKLPKLIENHLEDPEVRKRKVKSNLVF